MAPVLTSWNQRFLEWRQRLQQWRSQSTTVSFNGQIYKISYRHSTLTVATSESSPPAWSCEQLPSTKTADWELDLGRGAARIAHTALSESAARRARAFIAESQFSVPLEELWVGGVPLSHKDKLLRLALCSTPKKEISTLVGILPMGLLPTALPWISTLPSGRCITGLNVGDWELLSLWDNGELQALRQIPKAAATSLRLTLSEWSEGSPTRLWYGSVREGWSSANLPCDEKALPSLLGGILALKWPQWVDLHPCRLQRVLSRKWIQNSCWGLGALSMLLMVFGWLDVSWEEERYAEDYGISYAEAPDQISLLERQILLDQVPFSPEPTIPRVSQVIQWIASQPEWQASRGVEIDRLRYQLVQYPASGKERDPYLAKISLEFRCAQPFVAREFLERLSKGEPNSLVDPKFPAEWSHHDGLYRVSFQLKRSK